MDSTPENPDKTQSKTSPLQTEAALPAITSPSWLSRNRSGLILSALLIGVTLLLGIIYDMKLKERSDWGNPLVDENFESPGWEKNWILSSNRWIVTNGHLQAIEKPAKSESIFYKQQVSAPVAIEFDCLVHKEYINNDLTGDLSVVWSEGNDVNDWASYTMLQLGAYKNQISLITQFRTGKYSSQTILSMSEFVVEDGKTYHVRAEIEGTHIRILCNQQQIMETTTLFPLTSGHIGLWLGSGFADKRYDNLKISSKGMAEKLPATIIGDHYFQRKQYDDAAREYGLVTRSRMSAEMMEQAFYKQGLSYWLGKHPTEALEAWKNVTNPTLRLDSRLHVLRGEFEKGNLDVVIKELKTLTSEFPFENTPLIRIFWGQCAVLLPDLYCLKSDAEQFLGLADFTKTPWSECSSGLYKILMELGEYQKIEAELKRLPYTGAGYLVQMGEYEKAIELFPKNVPFKKQAFLSQKKFAELKKAMPYDQSAGADIEFFEKGVDEAIKKFPNDRQLNMIKFLSEGNQEGILQKYLENKNYAIYPYLWLGESTDLASNTILDERTKLFGKYHQAFWNYTHGNREQGYQDYFVNQRWISERLIMPPWFEQWILPAFLTLDSGDKAKATGMLEAFLKEPKNQFLHEQAPWHFIQYLLGKTTEEAFLAQPRKLDLNARLLLAKAIRSELEGKPQDAVPYYADYQKLPINQKILAVMPSKFVEWRVTTLPPSP